MPPVGLEPTISAGERPQTYALDSAATATGNLPVTFRIFNAIKGEIIYNPMRYAKWQMKAFQNMSNIVGTGLDILVNASVSNVSDSEF